MARCKAGVEGPAPDARIRLITNLGTWWMLPKLVEHVMALDAPNQVGQRNEHKKRRRLPNPAFERGGNASIDSKRDWAWQPRSSGFNTKSSTSRAKSRRKAPTSRVKIHQALVANLVHIRDHGDTTLLAELFSVIPKGSRLKSYFAWCSKFTVSTSKDSFGTVKIRKGRMPEQFDILGAMAIAPWDL